MTRREPNRTLLILLGPAVVVVLAMAIYALVTQVAFPPNKVAVYKSLFIEKCIPRLASRALGKDRYVDLGNDQKPFLHEQTGILITQSARTCRVEDDALMSEEERESVTDFVETYISNTFPQLNHPGDEMPNWDYFYSRVYLDRVNERRSWGIIILRPSNYSQDALQTTSTTLALPDEP